MCVDCIGVVAAQTWWHVLSFWKLFDMDSFERHDEFQAALPILLPPHGKDDAFVFRFSFYSYLYSVVSGCHQSHLVVSMRYAADLGWERWFLTFSTLPISLVCLFQGERHVLYSYHHHKANANCYCAWYQWTIGTHGYKWVMVDAKIQAFLYVCVCVCEEQWQQLKLNSNSGLFQCGREAQHLHDVRCQE